jgi:Tfp pilus assembly protein PilO
MNAAALQRRLVYQLLRLAWPGWLGLALLAAAAVYAAAVVLPAQGEMVRLGRRVARAEADLRGDAAGQARPLSAGEQLARFYETFPKDTSVPHWLGRLNAIALREGLSLDVGNYALLRNHSARLDRFRITLPIKGSYTQVRKFIAAALASAPALSLESVSFKREKVGDGQVEARVDFLLFLEKNT